MRSMLRLLKSLNDVFVWLIMVAIRKRRARIVIMMVAIVYCLYKDTKWSKS